MKRFEKESLIAYHMRITFAITGEQLFIGFVEVQIHMDYYRAIML